MTIEGQLLYLFITWVFAAFTYYQGTKTGKVEGLAIGSIALIHLLEQSKVIKVIRSSEDEIESIKGTNSDAILRF